MGEARTEHCLLNLNLSFVSTKALARQGRITRQGFPLQ